MNIQIDIQRNSGCLIKFDDGPEVFVPPFLAKVKGGSFDVAYKKLNDLIESNKADCIAAHDREVTNIAVIFYSKTLYTIDGDYFIEAELGIVIQ